MKLRMAALLLFSAATLAAQTSDDISFQRTFLLKNVSGTASNPGVNPHQAHFFTRGEWTLFREGTVFLTHVSEHGPEEPRTQMFSTNWFAGGAQRQVGNRGLLLLRGRVSLEPVTIPEEGYPHIMQWLSPEAGGPQMDSQRAHDFAGELAAHLALRMGTASFVHLYAAAVGDPALGALPHAQRASSEEFAEAPFSYDVDEIFHDATRVVTAGWANRYFGVEGSVFHDAVSTGRHSSIDDGPIDSWSGRVTVTPTRNVSLQLSQGSLGDADRSVSSASASYGSDRVLFTAMYTQRDGTSGETLTAFSGETTLRWGPSSFLARAESVDRPAGFLGAPRTRTTSHFIVGYLFDFFRGPWRAALGVNLDYHTQTHAFEHIYGHKPQSIYLFTRLRTGSRWSTGTR